MYIGALLSKMVNEENNSCWAMSSDIYCQSTVVNAEDVLSNDALRLPSKCHTPIANRYCLEIDVTYGRSN